MLRTLYQAGLRWQADNASYLGAAIAYYALFSVAPLLVIAIAVAGMVYGREAAEGKLVATLSDHVGPETARTLQGLVHQAEVGSGVAAVVGGAVLLFMAMSLFQQLKTALAILWKLPPRQEALVAGTVRSYLLAFATLLVAVLFATGVVVSSTAATLFLEVGGHPLLYRAGNLALSLVVLTLGFVFLFRLLSDGRVEYRHLWAGAFVTAVLFVLGKWLFGVYLRNTSLLSAYGAASSLVVFLVWVYYSAQLVFYGAEVVQVRREAAAA